MSNAQKIPFTRSLDRHAVKRIEDAMQREGQSLPCSVVSVSGSIVTVRFEVLGLFTLPQVTVPLFGPEYIRYPIQPGDKGVAFAASARLGGMSGLGDGVADLGQPSNLGALVFFPIGNATWGAVDPESVTIYGPNGVVLRNTGSDTVITLTPSGVTVVAQNLFTVSTSGCTLTMTAAGAYSLTGTASGTISAPSLTFTDAVHTTGPTVMHDAWQGLVNWANSHTHNQSGGGTTSAPVTPFSGGSIAP